MWKVVFQDGISHIEAVVIFRIGHTIKQAVDECHCDFRSPSLFLSIGIYVIDLQTVRERLEERSPNHDRIVFDQMLLTF